MKMATSLLLNFSCLTYRKCDVIIIVLGCVRYMCVFLIRVVQLSLIIIFGSRKNVSQALSAPSGITVGTFLASVPTEVEKKRTLPFLLSIDSTEKCPYRFIQVY